jgi:4-oxalocrotonate tautomerase
MPFVRIELFPGRTREQKAAAAKAVTEALVNTLGGSGPESVYITFWEMQREDCAVGGLLKDEPAAPSKGP